MCERRATEEGVDQDQEGRKKEGGMEFEEGGWCRVKGPKKKRRGGEGGEGVVKEVKRRWVRRRVVVLGETRRTDF